MLQVTNSVFTVQCVNLFAVNTVTATRIGWFDADIAIKFKLRFESMLAETESLIQCYYEKILISKILHISSRHRSRACKAMYFNKMTITLWSYIFVILIYDTPQLKSEWRNKIKGKTIITIAKMTKDDLLEKFRTRK